MRLIWLKKIVLALALVSLGSLAVFLFLLNYHPPDTVGRALLHLSYKSTTLARLPLPSGWRARYGFDRHEKCAILLDAALVPRLMACTVGYGRENNDFSREPIDAAAKANQAAATLRGKPGERVSSDIRQTPSGPIHHVVRTYHTSASFYVVTTGQVVEHQFFRMVGNDLVQLRTYEDVTQRASLDPIAWQLAQSMTLVPEPIALLKTHPTCRAAAPVRPWSPAS